MNYEYKALRRAGFGVTLIDSGYFDGNTYFKPLEAQDLLIADNLLISLEANINARIQMERKKFDPNIFYIDLHREFIQTDINRSYVSIPLDPAVIKSNRSVVLSLYCERFVETSQSYLYYDIEGNLSSAIVHVANMTFFLDEPFMDEDNFVFSEFRWHKNSTN